MTLRQRKYSITFSPNPKAEGDQNFREFTIDSSSRMRISFTIEKTPDISANTATLQIWNMNISHRNAIAKRFFKQQQPTGAIVTLSAGYESFSPEIFKGVIWESFSQKESADWITKITAGSGIDSFNGAVLNKGYTKNTLKSKIIEDAFDEISKVSGLGKLKPEFKSLIRSKLTGTHSNGKSYFKLATDVIKDILSEVNLEGSFDEKGIKITEIGKADSSRTHIYKEETGLIGAPTITNIGANFTTLLSPAVYVHNSVSLESKTGSGNYVVERLSHTGDFLGASWFTNHTCRRQ